jgi:flagellar assembly protein FliH
LRAEGAASVGSFAIERSKPVFRPWANGGSLEPLNEAEMPFAADAATLQAAAFAEGFEEGRSTVELELAGERDALARLAEAMETLRPEPTDALAALLAETVERLVRQIVGEVAIDPALLIGRAEAAAALIGDEVGPSKLRVHPDDVAHLAGARIPMPVAGDASLDRGSIVLETASGWIEDGPAVRLERLRAELDRMGAF